MSGDIHERMVGAQGYLAHRYTKWSSESAHSFAGADQIERRCPLLEPVYKEELIFILMNTITYLSTDKFMINMVRLQTIAVLLSCAAQGLSIGCEYVGLDTFQYRSTRNIITQLDPLVEGPGFEIVDPYKCSWRFHVPSDRKTPPASIRDFSKVFRTCE